MNSNSSPSIGSSCVKYSDRGLGYRLRVLSEILSTSPADVPVWLL